ncbi:MAG TPA: hypothetical protein PKL65_05415 [Bacteroidales bacterium]|jgi:hypothetical protein|nr:hypothetical protein [Bacteroidales bacterium]HNR41651.1 hypothetical protein [Bacteroidales bacterium]HPM17767.1 hypothetical protein [Bacteroidales bacterium]HQG77709.1 hypothetical protein [Bacteroidales bacterium]
MKKLMFILVLAVLAMTVDAQRTAVKTADLQKSITDWITKDYAGFAITKADKVVANNVTTFEVVITKGSNSETLVFDKDGKFMHKMALKSGSPEKHTAGSSPMAHHKPETKPKTGKK